MSDGRYRREMLWGLLAVQNDLVAANDLIAAVNVWVQDKSGPLADALPAGTLTDEARSLLDALVNEHLVRHDNDTDKSLAALSSVGSVHDELTLISDPVIEATMTLLGPRHQRGEQERAEDDLSAGRAGSRFRILRRHARGGLGEVFVARDEEINRDVALKEIQSAQSDQTESRARFMLEAEVTGGLEHPGIVPVYGLGQYADGRPYYAMRFIRGDSLKTAVERFHADGEDTTSADRIVELRKLLGRFVDVCCAMQYAHSRGVLHRDLKPGNIMLGKYGETLVVDWGLARTSERDIPVGESEEGALVPSSASGSAPTLMGTAIGTPSYMSPEQAAGRLDELGPASDVYSLGATLYHILTGRAPFGGKGIREVLAQVKDGDFPPPTAVRPGTPRALEAICLKAMALQPSDRYASPMEISDDIERFLADEAVEAFAEPLPTRVRRWIRKHQTLSVTTAAVVLITAVGFGVFSFVLSGKNRALTEANRRENTARLAAEDQSRLALSTLSSVVGDLQASISSLPGGATVRRRVLRTSLEQFDQIAAEYVGQGEIDGKTMGALDQLGDALLDMGALDTGGEAGEGRSAVQIAESLFDRMLTIAQARHDEQPDDADRLYDLAIAWTNLGNAKLRTGRPNEALGDYRRALEARQRVKEVDPEHWDADNSIALAWDKIGKALRDTGDTAGSVDAHSRALKMRLVLVENSPDDMEEQRSLAVTYNELGLLYRQRGRLTEAEDVYKKSLELFKALALAEPENSRYRRDHAVGLTALAQTTRHLGRLDDAITMFEEAVVIRKDLMQDDPFDAENKRGLTGVYELLAEAWRYSGNVEKRLETLQTKLVIDQELVTADPHDFNANQQLAITYERLGGTRREMGDPRGSLEDHQKALEIHQRMVERDPTIVSARRGLAYAHTKKSHVAMQLGDPATALAGFQAGLAIREKLAADDPGNSEVLRELSQSCQYTADAYRAQGNAVEALPLYRRSLGIAKRIAEADPQDTRLQQDLSITWNKMGDGHLLAGDIDDGIAAFEESLKICENLVETDTTNAMAHRDLATTLERIGIALQRAQRYGDALGYFERMYEIKKRLADADPASALGQREYWISLNHIGYTLFHLGRYPEAAEKFRYGLRIVRRMVENQQLVEESTMKIGQFENMIATSETADAALGPWDGVLALPAERLGGALEMRSLHFARKGEGDLAAQASRHMLQLDHKNKDQYYNAACAMGLSATAIKAAEGEELTAEQAEKRAAFCEDAIKLLQKSIEAGWSDFAHLRSDTDLTPLQDLPAFKALFPEDSGGAD